MMSGSFLIVLLWLLTKSQLILSAESICRYKLDNCSCSEEKYYKYKILCSYEDHSSIEVKIIKPYAFIRCIKSPSWSDFQYVWPVDPHIHRIRFFNCSAPHKSEDSQRLANSINAQGIQNLRYYNLNGSFHSHNLEAYPNLVQLDFYDSDITNADFDFLKGIKNFFILLFYGLAYLLEIFCQTLITRVKWPIFSIIFIMPFDDLIK